MPVAPHQAALNRLKQGSEQQKVQALFELARLVPAMEEAEKAYVRGRLHRLRIEESSDFVERLLTLLLIALDDVTALRQAQALFPRLSTFR